jgi:hypothetical protein
MFATVAPTTKASSPVRCAVISVDEDFIATLQTEQMGLCVQTSSEAGELAR